MKKLLGTLIGTCIISLSFAQSKKLTVAGEVTDERDAVLANVTVTIGNASTQTDASGKFSIQLEKQAILQVKASIVGFVDFTKTIAGNSNHYLNIVLKSKTYYLQPLEVKALRANNKAPFTKTNLSKEEIAKVNLGQDLPYVLNQTPSVVVNSDAGNGVGYTGIRIRGTDATRINVTLNGIPYNDAESQGTFFVDLPDFTSSANSIQIQRGVGTSSNGTGAFGATINVSTNEFNEKAYAELNNSFGSFNTWKNTVKAGSGIIGSGFTIDARLSKISSNGYIDRASSDLQSFYLSGAYTKKNYAFRLNIFSGKEKTYQAWNGIDAFTLASNRTFNPSGTEKAGSPYDNETDNYTQTHYQFFFNAKLNNNWTLNIANFLTRGIGYYENYKANQRFSSYGLPNFIVGTTTISRTDLVRRQWLDNYFYGQTASLQYKKEKNTLTFGGGWTFYDGGHIGNIIWANVGVPNNYKYYDVPATKSDANIYAKWQHDLNNNLSFFADVQYRATRHNMKGFKANPSLVIDRKFNFVNPKVGLTYIKNGWQTYVSYAMASKEPNRDDFEAGTTTQPTYETLHDFELGTEHKTSKYSFSANLYYMLYKNQLVLTGKINDVGAYTRTNVDNSYRAGIELQAGYVFNKWFNLNGNLTLSANKIKKFTEFYDDYDAGGQVAVPHTNTDIALSPNAVASILANFIASKSLEFGLIGKYVGKQYLDNSGNSDRTLGSFYTQDIRAIYHIKSKLVKKATLIAQVNNIFNRLYEPNGYTFSYKFGGAVTTENYYYPSAGTNFMVALNIQL